MQVMPASDMVISPFRRVSKSSGESLQPEGYLYVSVTYFENLAKKFFPSAPGFFVKIEQVLS